MVERCAPLLPVLALAGVMWGCSAGSPPPVTFSLTDLGTLSGTESYACAINDGGEFSSALAINEAGLIVGNAALRGNSRTHAALWIGTKIYDLNDLLDASGRGWTLFEARSINSSGQIVGYGRSLWGWGPQHGFLLTPTKPIPLPPKGGS